MIELGARPDGIRAAIGPCIGFESYEVGPEFPEPFLVQDRQNGRYFAKSARAGHFLFDLSGYLARRLPALRVVRVFRHDCDPLRDHSGARTGGERGVMSV